MDNIKTNEINEETTELTDKKKTEQLNKNDTEEIKDDVTETESDDKPDYIKQVRESESGLRNFQRFILHAIIFIVIIWLLFLKLIGITTMPNSDMYPRIDPGDLLLFYRLDKTPKAQDVVCYQKNGEDLVGRVIAVPGDVVNITENEMLEINGSTVVESNIFEKTPLYEGFVKYPFTVPADSYFILEDHRDGGEDSRYFGAVSKKEITGVVLNVIRRHNL